MAGEQLCLFGCDGGCGVCGREPSITTRCMTCCDTPHQCAECHRIDAGTVDAVVDIETHNVVGIFDRRSVASTLRDAEEQPYKDEVVEMLEGLLERARAGEFIGMAAVLDGPEGLAVIATLGAVEDAITYLGGISRLAHRIQKEVDCDED